MPAMRGTAVHRELAHLGFADGASGLELRAR